MSRLSDQLSSRSSPFPAFANDQFEEALSYSGIMEEYGTNHEKREADVQLVRKIRSPQENNMAHQLYTKNSQTGFGILHVPLFTRDYHKVEETWSDSNANPLMPPVYSSAG
ncbi:hypothetical protein C0J52_11051 [Blattella germanica]|nr:hypothetical protein C0J52_11051 [Blattella germanica]